MKIIALIAAAFLIGGCQLAEHGYPGTKSSLDGTASTAPTPALPTKPDLTIVLHAVVSTGSDANHAIVQFDWDIAATGAGAIAPFSVIVKEDGFNDPVSGDFVHGLTVNGTYHGPIGRSDGLSGPIIVGPGVHTFTAIVDDTNLVDESNENNNTSVVIITVPPVGNG